MMIICPDMPPRFRRVVYHLSERITNWSYNLHDSGIRSPESGWISHVAWLLYILSFNIIILVAEIMLYIYIYTILYIRYIINHHIGRVDKEKGFQQSIIYHLDLSSQCWQESFSVWTAKPQRLVFAWNARTDGRTVRLMVVQHWHL